LEQLRLQEAAEEEQAMVEQVLLEVLEVVHPLGMVVLEEQELTVKEVMEEHLLDMALHTLLLAAVVLEQ
jgi:hypothetical protein